MGSKMITDITSTQTTINDTDNFILQETGGGTTKKTVWSTIKSNLKTYFDGIYAPVVDNTGGWVSAGETWTYASADDPTYTFTVSGDVTTKYSAGMKLKLTQTTAKYFIITLAPTYSSGTGLTTITVYGGTDYDLADAAITSPYYSMVKAPFGFPLARAKWTTVFINDSGARSITSPTNDTWYGGTNAWTSGANISGYIHPGLWDVTGGSFLGANKTTTALSIQYTLSADPNAIGTPFTGIGYDTISSMHVYGNFQSLSVASKTLYYILVNSKIGSISSISISYTSAYFTCAYL